MTVVVSDTSVLCYLALLGRLDVLEKLFGEVLIPNAVLRECVHAGAPEGLRDALFHDIPSFIKVSADDPVPLLETETLDIGEATAITIAWQHRADSLLLLDEKRGRAIAGSLGLRLRGVLGIIVECHRRNILDFDSTIARLRQFGFRIASATIDAARTQLGLSR